MMGRLGHMAYCTFILFYGYLLGIFKGLFVCKLFLNVDHYPEIEFQIKIQSTP